MGRKNSREAKRQRREQRQARKQHNTHQSNLQRQASKLRLFVEENGITIYDSDVEALEEQLQAAEAEDLPLGKTLDLYKRHREEIQRRASQKQVASAKTVALMLGMLGA